MVERAQYSADEPRHTGWVNPYTGRFFEGPYWPAGSNALATPLRECAAAVNAKTTHATMVR